MKYCTICGKTYPDNCHICNSCNSFLQSNEYKNEQGGQGSMLITQNHNTAAVPATLSNANYANYTSQNPKQKKKKSCLSNFLIVTAVFIIFVIFCAVISESDDAAVDEPISASTEENISNTEATNTENSSTTTTDSNAQSTEDTDNLRSDMTSVVVYDSSLNASYIDITYEEFVRGIAPYFYEIGVDEESAVEIFLSHTPKLRSSDYWPKETNYYCIYLYRPEFLSYVSIEIDTVPETDKIVYIRLISTAGDVEIERRSALWTVWSGVSMEFIAGSDFETILTGGTKDYYLPNSTTEYFNDFKDVHFYLGMSSKGFNEMKIYAVQ